VGEPKTLREALDAIQEMLSDKPYSADLWDVLVALRGPDCRNHKLKMATTCVIRDAAFPKHPCEERSFYNKPTQETRKCLEGMFTDKRNRPHFREHVWDALIVLGI